MGAEKYSFQFKSSKRYMSFEEANHRDWWQLLGYLRKGTCSQKCKRLYNQNWDCY